VSQYSIKDLEHLSGIKAHTLRIWEQRYDLLNPKRTSTNIRFYDNEDLKLLLNVSVLNDHGYRISKISRMSREEMQGEVLRLSQEYCHYPDQIQNLCIAMVDMDETRFDRVMSSNIRRIGLEKTMLDVVYPFLTRIGIMWQTGFINPAQEHFITNLIRQKIIVAIDSTTVVVTDKSRKFVLFLPEGELHEIGLLFAYFLLKARNHTVYYLGQSMPVKDLFTVVNILKPDYVFGIFNVNESQEQVDTYFNTLTEHLPCGRVMAGGSYLIEHPIQNSAKFLRVVGIKEFLHFLDDMPSYEATVW
jgi:MerR family transcriptional regulator, light-induced transcriptional regulator